MVEVGAIHLFHFSTIPKDSCWCHNPIILISIHIGLFWNYNLNFRFIMFIFTDGKFKGLRIHSF